MGDINKVEKFLLNDLGVPKDVIGFAKDAAQWASLGTQFFGYAKLAVGFFDMIFGEKKPSLDEMINNLGTKVDSLLDIIEKQFGYEVAKEFRDHRKKISEYREKIEQYRNLFLTFQSGPTPERFQELVASLDFDLPAGLKELMTREINELPIARSSYEGGETYDWFFGGLLWSNYWYSRLQHYPLMSLQRAKLPDSLVPLPEYNAPPPEMGQLHLKAESLRAFDMPQPDGKPIGEVVARWDGRFSLPVILQGLGVLEGILRRVEPHFRSTRFFEQTIADLNYALRQYLAEWAETIVWTIEMPFVLPNTSSTVPIFMGYSSYPCQVVDPVFGVSAGLNPFWTSQWNEETVSVHAHDTSMYDYDSKAFPPQFHERVYEGWTPQQAEQFRKLRLEMLGELLAASGYHDALNYVRSFAKLAGAPDDSECLQIFNNQKKVSFPPFPDGIIPPLATPVTVKTNGSFFSEPVLFQGQRQVRAVKVTMPIAIQPNPAPAFKVRTAASDVEFGYKITVSPKGSDKEVPIFERKLRRQVGEAGMYHNQKNEAIGLPYTEKKTVKFLTPTFEVLTNEAGTRQLKYGEAVSRNVAFSCSVTVFDQEMHKLKLGDQEPMRGAIMLEITSADSKVYSHEVEVTVTETCPGENGTTHAYTAMTGVIPIHARVIVLPNKYFETLDQEAEANKDALSYGEKAKEKYQERPSFPSEERLDLAAGLRSLLKDPSITGALILDAERHFKRRISKSDLLNLVSRMGIQAGQKDVAFSLSPVALKDIRGRRADLLMPTRTQALGPDSAGVTDPLLGRS